MSGKSGGTTGAHCDMEKQVEKEERQQKQRKILYFLKHGHMGDDVSFFPESKGLFLSNYWDTWETVSVSSVKC